MDDLEELRQKLREFAEERDWDQFHTPKNLAMALSAEVAEVIEHFQWLTPLDSALLPDHKRALVALELADVLLYLVRLADKLDVDLVDVAHRKLLMNEARYPADEVRGSAEKR